MEREDSLRWDQFCKLGEMMGDGLHHEADGKWIVKEYRRLAKSLMPDIYKVDPDVKRLRGLSIDEQMTKLCISNKCKCGGNLKQKRKGTKVAYCESCNARYKARTKKIK